MSKKKKHKKGKKLKIRKREAIVLGALLGIGCYFYDRYVKAQLPAKKKKHKKYPNLQSIV